MAVGKWIFNPFTCTLDYYEPSGGGGGTGNCLITDDGTYYVVTIGTGNGTIEDDGTYWKLKNDLGQYLLKVRKADGQLMIQSGYDTDTGAIPDDVLFIVRKSDGQLFIRGGIDTDTPI